MNAVSQYKHLKQSIRDAGLVMLNIRFVRVDDERGYDLVVGETRMRLNDTFAVIAMLHREV